MAKKDLYVIFNGMFLFNWKASTEELEVYLPKHGDTHYNFVAQNLDLNQGAVVLPENQALTIQPLGTVATPTRFNKYQSLAIDGKEYEINAATQPFAKFLLPWPDHVFTPQSWLVWKDNYVGATKVGATLSPDVSQGVEDHQGRKHTAIAVSEVLVLKYVSAEPASLVSNGTRIDSIASGQVQLLGIFAAVYEAHAGHPHDDVFNKLLIHAIDKTPPKYRPSASPKALGQKAAVPVPGTSPSQDIPDDWLQSHEVQTSREGVIRIRTSSGMGSCDNGNRCEDC